MLKLFLFMNFFDFASCSLKGALNSKEFFDSHKCKAQHDIKNNPFLKPVEWTYDNFINEAQKLEAKLEEFELSFEEQCRTIEILQKNFSQLEEEMNAFIGNIEKEDISETELFE